MSNSRDRNIIGVGCNIGGKSIVGDNSGNRGRNNEGDVNNVLPPDSRTDWDHIACDNSYLNSEAYPRSTGRNKNVIGAETQIKMDSIVGDWSGNNNGAESCGTNIIGDKSGNSPPGYLKTADCPSKNQKHDSSRISGHYIVGDYSGNIGNLDDIPNGRGNNNMNKLLEAPFQCKNKIDANTNLQRNSIVGDVSGNNMNNSAVESHKDQRAAATTKTTPTQKKKKKAANNSTNKVGDNNRPIKS